MWSGQWIPQNACFLEVSNGGTSELQTFDVAKSRLGERYDDK
jgi:hypothetical protein